MSEIIETVNNPNMDQQWQLACDYANARAINRIKTAALTPDAERDVLIKERSDKYKALMKVESARRKEQIRQKSPEEIKAAKVDNERYEREQLETRKLRQHVTNQLESIKMHSAVEINKVDKEMAELLPKVLAGIESEDKEMELINKRMRIESRQRTTLMLANDPHALDGIKASKKSWQ